MSAVATIAESRPPCAHDQVQRAPWAVPMAVLDAELARGDVHRTLGAWHTVCAVGLDDGSWEAMLAVGYAAARAARRVGFRLAFTAKARQAYRIALARAEAAGSHQGLLLLADAFTALGDEAAADECRRLRARTTSAAARHYSLTGPRG